MLVKLKPFRANYIQMFIQYWNIKFYVYGIQLSSKIFSLLCSSESCAYMYIYQYNCFFTTIPAAEQNQESPVGTYFKIILIFFSVQAKCDGCDLFASNEYFVICSQSAIQTYWFICLILVTKVQNSSFVSIMIHYVIFFFSSIQLMSNTSIQVGLRRKYDLI